MGVDRQELADLIAKQQDRAEQEINEIRADQIEQLQGPRNAMEEYFIAQLARLRQKEIQEANNAYLTEEDKRQLALSPLRARAGIDGRFMAGAEARAEANIAEDERDMAEAIKGDEQEPGLDLPQSAMEASVAGSMRTGDPGTMGEQDRSDLVELEKIKNAVISGQVGLESIDEEFIDTTVMPIIARLNKERGLKGHNTRQTKSLMKQAVRERNIVKIAQLLTSALTLAGVQGATRGPGAKRT